MMDKIDHYSLTNPASIYDEEALTALELAGRTAAKLNEAVDQFNELETNTNNHLSRQDKTIDTRTNDLLNLLKKGLEQDMPAEVDQEVLEHIESGEFDAQIESHIGNLAARLDNLLGSVTTGSTTLDAELIDMRTGWDGKTYASAGEALRKQVYRHYTAITTTSDIDYVVQPDAYVLDVTNCPNFPVKRTDGSSSSGLLYVVGWGQNSRWLMQIAAPLNAHETGVDTRLFMRFGANSTYRTQHTNFDYTMSVAWGAWVDLNPVRVNLKTAGIDLNTVTDKGDYVVQVSDAVNSPITGKGFLLTVETLKPYLIQTATTITGETQYFRVGRIDGTDWKAWQKYATYADVVNMLANYNQSNTGYTILNMGDSITDYDSDGTSVSSFLSQFTGAKTVNCGFGGCRMTPHTSANYKPFSMCELADAIATYDFSAQEAKVATETSYATRLSDLKSNIALANLITIGYGTNDFTAGVTLDDPTNSKNKSTFGGALRYSIETLMGARPDRRLVIIAPTYRWWKDDNGVFTDDSDTREIEGQKLHEFVDKCIEIGKEYHIPVVNPYDEMGINRFNRPLWFRDNDGTHPSENGKKLLAKLIADTVKRM